MKILRLLSSLAAGLTFTLCAVPVVYAAPCTDSSRPFSICEDFNGTALDASVWKHISASRGEGTAGSTATVHDGYLDLVMNQTDNGGAVVARFSPLTNLKLTFRHRMHPASSGQPYFPSVRMESAAGSYVASLAWVKSSYAPDYCNKTNDRIKLMVDHSVNSCSTTIFSTATASSFFDRWSDVVLQYQMDTGVITVDLDGDGIADMQTIVPLANRKAVTGIYIDPFGWYTGHSHQVDSIRIEGDSQIRTATPSVSAGLYHTCAVLASGAVQCWGRNTYGELGNGSKTDSSVPVLVKGITNAKAVSAGAYFTCAVLDTGEVKCWGFNRFGQLGNGNMTDSVAPVVVSGIASATLVSAGGGGAHTCAVLISGAVQCWGFNGSGQLGNGSRTDSSSPVPVSGIANALTVSLGGHSSCAVTGSGAIQCWGDNSYGKLGNGDPNLGFSTVPLTVKGVTDSIAVSTGNTQTCALLRTGTILCWGTNRNGELGIGSRTDSITPVTVSNITTAASISLRYGGACAVLGEGEVKCWGANGVGQLGNGNTTDSLVPVSVVGISNVTSMSAGPEASCAVTRGDAVHCWGRNLYGSIGNGSTTGSSSPVQVTGSDGQGLLTLGSTSYTLTAFKTGTGQGSIASSPTGISCGSDCTENYASGTSVMLTATVSSGSTFTGWSGACSGTGPCTVSMIDAKSVSANFSLAAPIFSISPSNTVLAGSTITFNISGTNGAASYKLFLRTEQAAFSDQVSLDIQPGQKIVIPTEFVGTLYLAVKAFSGNVASPFSDEIKLVSGTPVVGFRKSFSDLGMIANQSTWGGVSANVNAKGMIAIKHDRMEAFKAIFHDTKTGNRIKEYLVPARTDGVLSKTSSAYSDLLKLNPSAFVQFLLDGTSLEVNTFYKPTDLPPDVSITYVNGTEETIVATGLSAFLKTIALAFISADAANLSPTEKQMESFRDVVNVVINELWSEIRKDAQLWSKLHASMKNRDLTSAISHLTDWCGDGNVFDGEEKCYTIVSGALIKLYAQNDAEVLGKIYKPSVLNKIDQVTKLVSAAGALTDTATLLANVGLQINRGPSLFGFDLGYGASGYLSPYYRFNWIDSTYGTGDSVLYTGSSNALDMKNMQWAQFFSTDAVRKAEFYRYQITKGGSLSISSTVNFNPEAVTTGQLDNQTLSAGKLYSTEDSGKVGYVYVGATILTPTGTFRLYKSGDGRWTVVNSIYEMRPATAPKVFSDNVTVNIFENLDLSGYPGSVVWVGYGVGADESVAIQDMLQGSKIRIVYRVD